MMPARGILASACPMFCPALWACGCADGRGGDGGSGTVDFADYLGPDTLHLEYAPAGAPAAAPRMVRVELGTWLVRQGETWSEGAELGSFEAEADDGFWLSSAGEDTQLLPADVSVGSAGEGVSVLDSGSTAVWYGTFDNTVTVEITDGRWSGIQVFAKGIGPIVATLDGDLRELVYYE